MGNQFPLTKLGYLLLRQLAKPIANFVTKRAKNSKIFSRYVFIPTAQMFHYLDVKIRMKILQLGKVNSVPKLDEKRAIETGTQILAEVVIISFTSSVIILEYKRQMENERIKEEQRAEEMNELKSKAKNANDIVAVLSKDIETLRNQLEQLTKLKNELKKS